MRSAQRLLVCVVSGRRSSRGYTRESSSICLLQSRCVKRAPLINAREGRVYARGVVMSVRDVRRVTSLFPPFPPPSPLLAPRSTADGHALVLLARALVRMVRGECVDARSRTRLLAPRKLSHGVAVR